MSSAVSKGVIPYLLTRGLLLAFMAGLWAPAATGAEDSQELPPSRFLNDEPTRMPPAPPPAQEQHMEWDKPVVSRGVGGRAIRGQEEPPRIRQRYTQGQSAYFFQRYQQAYQLWLPLAQAGFADAQASIGWLHQAGLGVDKDLSRAVYWYQQAVKQQHAVALNNLASFYQHGVELPQDLQKARELYEQSARQGYRFAQYNLAVLLQAHWPEDGQIRYWLQRAADQDVPQAQQRLQELTAGGGVQKE